MTRPTFSGRRLVAATIALVGLSVLSAAPAGAATTPGADKSYSQNGSSAEVFATTCVDVGVDLMTCTDVQLGAFVGKMTDGFSGVTHPNQVCATIGTSTIDTLTWEYVGDPVYERGCATDLPTGTIRIDSKLNWATLAVTRLTVGQEDCDKESCVPGPTRVVDVSGSWAQAGPIAISKARSTFLDDQCRVDSSFKGSGRVASFRGSFGGIVLDNPDLGYLTSGRETFRSRCSEG